MEHIAPLVQTLLWVLLIAGITLRFHKPLYDLLEALARRISAGSTIKAGPLELGAPIPLSAAEQSARLTDEVTQLKSDASGLSGAQHHALPPSAGLKVRYLHAEDLSLRALQQLYGVPIAREVALGPRLRVDGVFNLQNQINIVEVKLVLARSFARRLARDAVAMLRTQILATPGYIHGTIRIVLVLVTEEPAITEVERTELEGDLSNEAIPIVVHVFSLRELAKRFGMDETQ